MKASRPKKILLNAAASSIFLRVLASIWHGNITTPIMMPAKCSRASSNEFVPKDIDPIHSMSHISARDCVSCSVLKLPLNMCRFWIALCSILASSFRYLYYRVFSYLSTILDLYWKIWLHTLAVVEKSIKKDIIFSSKGNIKIVWGGNLSSLLQSLSFLLGMCCFARSFSYLSLVISVRWLIK